MEENVKENPKKHSKKLKTCLIVLLVIFAIILVNFIRNAIIDITYEFDTVKDEDVMAQKEEDYGNLDDNETETKSTDSVMKAIVVKANENDLLVVPTNKLKELYSVSLKEIEKKGFKKNQEIEITWNGDILTIYPGQINSVSKIDIVKEETDEEIPEEILRFCYSKIDNVSVKINEFTLDKIKFTITDKNEIPYTYNKEDFKLYKKELNENYTGVEQKVGEETEHSTAGYTGTGSPYNWEKVGFQDDLLNDGVMNISKDNQNIIFEIDLEKAYGNLESGEYYFILAGIDIHIRINFEINENGKLICSEPKVEW